GTLGRMGDLDPRIARLKDQLLTAPYEICMARAFYFTRVYRETEGMDPCLRNALALECTLEKQKIQIYPDEYIAGSKTERFLAGPLSVERGDFLRTLQLEMEILHRKHRPFSISEEDKKIFWDEILPYWDGKTLRDCKAREWEKDGIINTRPSLLGKLMSWIKAVRFARYIGRQSLRKISGANVYARLTRRRIRLLRALQYELARNNPTPATFCFDVQGHLSLGVDKVVARGMGAIIKEAEERLGQIEREEPDNESGRNFLKAVIISLKAAIHYAERFAALAEEMAAGAKDEKEKDRLQLIATHCRNVPRNAPRSFHEALQAAWFTLLVGEIQYGTHEVFAVGRADQYLYPYFRKDIEEGRLTKKEAMALLQEFYLKLSANIEPIPEVGMETNATLGNNQHCVTIGGQTPDGKDAANELSMLMLEAHAQMGGAINQLSVRIHDDSPEEFVRRTAEVFRYANGIAIYNDEAIVKGLDADGLSQEDARDYCIVGCIETSGQSDTHGCPGGHELVLPAVLLMTLTRGKMPPPSLGQQGGYDSGDPQKFTTFDQLKSAFRKQLTHQIKVLIEATAGKDRAYREILPAPYVSALMDDCIKNAADITAGGARYDLTSVDVRGLATLVDSLLAMKSFVYDRKELMLRELIGICSDNFEGNEALRQRIIHGAPKYGVGDTEGDEMALRVLSWIYEEASKYRNIRGGHFRVCYYSYGNHVIDGFMLGASPDGRRQGEPISNGVSPSNLIGAGAGPTGAMKTIARFPPHQVSSGIALNIRFHPDFLGSEEKLDTFASMIRTYFRLGGMHLQPNVVSTEVLRDAQSHPDKYRDLIVKVSGYSAYFTDLGKSIQQDIIARVEFGR
ncbi:MAG: hypothetical protein JSU92_07595, partial [Deltaproteobacteria bacterium]